MQQGDKFPHNTEFLYIPVNKQEDPLSCSRPIKLSFDKLINQGALLILSIPGAFSPTCTETHLPDILNNVGKLKALGIKNVVIYAVNDAFVMNAWGKLLLNKYNVDDSLPILFASDPNSKFTQANGLGVDKSTFGIGFRSDRFAMVVKDHEIKYLKRDPTGLEGSGSKGILTAKL